LHPGICFDLDRGSGKLLLRSSKLGSSIDSRGYEAVLPQQLQLAGGLCAEAQSALPSWLTSNG
jgi:hypothetical protein